MSAGRASRAGVTTSDLVIRRSRVVATPGQAVSIHGSPRPAPVRRSLVATVRPLEARLRPGAPEGGGGRNTDMPSSEPPTPLGISLRLYAQEAGPDLAKPRPGIDDVPVIAWVLLRALPAASLVAAVLVLILSNR